MTMTNQEIFDKGMQGVLKQEAFAWDVDEGECSYFDDCGNKCMIGHLVNDDMAREWQSSGKDLINICEERNINSVIFVESLQYAHDKIANDTAYVIGGKGTPKWDKREFLDGMRHFAIDNELEFNYE